MSFRPSPARFGGGAQYPYPKEVWSPAGGWWTRPQNWKSSTAFAFIGVGFVMYGVWNLSAAKEIRHTDPTRAIPSMMWSKQYKRGELGIKDESHLKPDEAPAAHH